MKRRRLFVGKENRAEQRRALKDEIFVRGMILKEFQQNVDEARRGEFVDGQSLLVEEKVFQFGQKFRQTFQRAERVLVVQLVHDALQIDQNRSREIRRHDVLQIFVVNEQGDFAGALFRMFLFASVHRNRRRLARWIRRRTKRFDR